MKLVTSLLFSLCFLVSGARAESVTARVVADDFYSVYVGNASGSSLTHVGGSGSTLWFGQGAPFGFAANPGDYLYVAARDSAGYGPRTCGSARSTSAERCSTRTRATGWRNTTVR